MTEQEICDKYTNDLFGYMHYLKDEPSDFMDDLESVLTIFDVNRGFSENSLEDPEGLLDVDYFLSYDKFKWLVDKACSAAWARTGEPLKWDAEPFFKKAILKYMEKLNG